MTLFTYRGRHTGQEIWDSEPGPALKIEKSGIRDWDTEEGFRESTLGIVPGTEKLKNVITNFREKLKKMSHILAI